MEETSNPYGPNEGDGCLGGPFAKPNYEFYAAVGFGILYALIMAMQ
jgi:hypothetical protein